jgi:hypothetical protein
MHYCGGECQRRDWLVHKLECKAYAAMRQLDRLAELDDDMARLFMRVLIKAQVSYSYTLK